MKLIASQFKAKYYSRKINWSYDFNNWYYILFWTYSYSGILKISTDWIQEYLS